MIPLFPTFKKIELSDKAEIESFTHTHPCYSDYDFASLWAWNLEEHVQFSRLNGNLVVKFSDYIDGEPFYSFLGNIDVNNTAHILLEHSHKNFEKSFLKLIPESSLGEIDTRIFKISEDEDNFDYMYLIEEHTKHEGSKFKVLRNSLSNFKRNHTNHQARTLDLSNEMTKVQILTLYKKWEQNKGFDIPNEFKALKRFLLAIDSFDYIAVGIFIDDIIAGYSINALLPQNHSNCLFAKADTEYSSVYAYLMNVTSHILYEKGYRYMNYEQDLGIESLRRSKKALQPVSFLKKYIIKLRD